MMRRLRRHMRALLGDGVSEPHFDVEPPSRVTLRPGYGGAELDAIGAALDADELEPAEALAAAYRLGEARALARTGEHALVLRQVLDRLMLEIAPRAERDRRGALQSARDSSPPPRAV